MIACIEYRTAINRQAATADAARKSIAQPLQSGDPAIEVNRPFS
jgi:ApbE superfamily uncharacterized protein (UPF0280 family)